LCNLTSAPVAQMDRAAVS